MPPRERAARAKHPFREQALFTLDWMFTSREPLSCTITKTNTGPGALRGFVLAQWPLRDIKALALAAASPAGPVWLPGSHRAGEGLSRAGSTLRATSNAAGLGWLLPGAPGFPKTA